MSHFTTRLTQKIEIGAVRRIMFDTEIIKTDGGNEVRNSRWATPLRSYDIALPPCTRDNVDYLSLIQMWNVTLGGLHSFDFVDWIDQTGNTVVNVRFDTPLQITGIAGHLDHIDTITLQEVRV